MIRVMESHEITVGCPDLFLRRRGRDSESRVWVTPKAPRRHFVGRWQNSQRMIAHLLKEYTGHQYDVTGSEKSDIRNQQYRPSCEVRKSWKGK
jgi:hypothetical protein